MIFLCGYGVVFLGNIVNGEKENCIGNALRTFGYALMGASVLLFLGKLMP